MKVSACVLVVCFLAINFLESEGCEIWNPSVCDQETHTPPPGFEKKHVQMFEDGTKILCMAHNKGEPYGPECEKAFAKDKCESKLFLQLH
ncbi:UNVERIFIED_CONTAM: hypothetical protein RMT77_003991 [Armadillidium vulgare]